MVGYIRTSGTRSQPLFGGGRQRANWREGSEGLCDITEVISVLVKQLYRLSVNVEMTFLGIPVLSSCAVLFTSCLFFF